MLMMRKAASLAALLATVPLALGQTPATTVVNKDFAKLSTYSGGLLPDSLTALFSVGQDTADTLVMSWFIMGADPACTPANLPNLAKNSSNACGIHIHSGTDCSSPGGHFYDSSTVTSDPWTIQYLAAATSSIGSGVRIKTGKSISDIVGKVAVIHDSQGTKGFCAQLQAVTYSASKYVVNSFMTYPGYSGTLKVGGSASIVQVMLGTTLEQDEVIGFSLTGVDPLCLGSSLAGLSATSGLPCGIHVHKGTSCASDSAVGGHWYDSSIPDFWMRVMYASSANGTTIGTTPPVWTNLNISDANGKTLVIHDSTGARIACGIIGSDSGTASGAKELYASSLLLVFVLVAQLF